MKLDKNFWKRLGKALTDYAAADDWKSPRSLKITHTSLFPSHVVGRGPNAGEPTLLDFSSKLIEADAIHFHFESKYGSKYGSIKILTRNKNESPNATFFEIRKNRKNLSFEYTHRRPAEGQHGWFIQDLCKKLEKSGFVDADDIESALKADGYSILTRFEFNSAGYSRIPHHSGRFSFVHPNYVKETRNGVEIGWLSQGTYNSLPHVLKIERCRGIPTRRLDTLGIEKSGYYDHHYKCEILPSQAKQAKAFFAKRIKN